MHKKFVSLAAPLVVGLLAIALGWFAHAAVPLSAQGAAVDGHAALSNPVLPAAPAATTARLTYQSRLTSSSGAPINAPVSVTFRIYSSTPAIAIWSSALRNITPTAGLFTVYLGDGADPVLADDILGQAVSVGVTVGADAEMAPRQPLYSVLGHGDNGVGVFGSSNTWVGVWGQSGNYYGVYGSSRSSIGVNGASISGDGVVGGSSSGNGVLGSSDTNVGVRGSSNSGTAVDGNSVDGFGVRGASYYSSGVSGFSTAADGVFGSTGDALHAGVAAQAAASSSMALDIKSGGIKATGAGIGTNTFAFIHQSTLTNTNPSTNFTTIDNALTNGDQNAMLYVTHVYNPTGAAPNLFNLSFGVYYNGAQWTIYREDGGMPFPTGITFNVMVIKR